VTAVAVKRKALAVDLRHLVLHESGYRCGNPGCRTILTLDIHHLDPVSEGGPNIAENLLPLCPNCHAQHHQGIIPKASLRTWKMLLLSLNEAFDKRSIDTLLALNSTGPLHVSGEGVLDCPGLIASGLVKPEIVRFADQYKVSLTAKGTQLVEAWKNGDQEAAAQ
jgi:hypothetical protein